MNCKYCTDNCQKAGSQKNGQQRYYCKICKKYQQDCYHYCAYNTCVNKMLPLLVCESVSIRGISRILRITTLTVIRRIRLLSESIKKPAIPKNCLSFELDEMCTYIGNKQNRYWIAYAFCSDTKRVIDFIVGKRTKGVLRIIVQTLLASKVRIIRTDKLNIYSTLIPAGKHDRHAHNINHIERNNLNIRTHLKRLSRRTICFSRSVIMLEACLKIYFWLK